MLNMVTMAIEFDGMSQTYQDALEIINRHTDTHTDTQTTLRHTQIQTHRPLYALDRHALEIRHTGHDTSHRDKHRHIHRHTDHDTSHTQTHTQTH